MTLAALCAACQHVPVAEDDWQRPRSADVALVMERLGCWGLCPSYRVVVHRDGLVEYDGWDKVKRQGHAVRRIPLETLFALVESAEAAHYFEEADHPRSSSSQAEAVRLYIDSQLGPHSLEHDHGDPSAPAWLDALEDRIDDAAGTEEWVGPRPRTARAP